MCHLVRPAYQPKITWFKMVVMDAILIEGAVKGYHECPFMVKTGESFILEKNIGSHGEAYNAIWVVRGIKRLV